MRYAGIPPDELLLNVQRFPPHVYDQLSKNDPAEIWGCLNSVYVMPHIRIAFRGALAGRDEEADRRHREFVAQMTQYADIQLIWVEGPEHRGEIPNIAHTGATVHAAPYPAFNIQDPTKIALLKLKHLVNTSLRGPGDIDYIVCLF